MTLVAALVVLAAIFIPRLLKGTGEEIKCPNFVGQMYDDIKANKEYNENFKLIPDWQPNSEYEYGVVYEQSETKNENLKKGAEITLYISMGAKTKKVPDVTEMTESEAVSIIKSAGFKHNVKFIASEDVEKDLVIKTDPQKTTVVAEGAEITIYISTGKPIKNVTVPDVVGILEEDAKTAISGEGLVAETKDAYITFADKFYPIGYVTAQNPAKKTSIVEGSTVEISVCVGYKYDVEVDLPDDFVSEKFYLSLWEGDKCVSTSEELSYSNSPYTFKGLTTTQEKQEVIVKISADKKTFENLYSFSVDNKNSKVRIIEQFPDYSKNDGSSDETIAVPDIIGKSVEEAKSLLDAEGILYEIHDESDNIVDAGTVSGVSSDSVAVGETLIVYVTVESGAVG